MEGEESHDNPAVEVQSHVLWFQGLGMLPVRHDAVGALQQQQQLAQQQQQQQQLAQQQQQQQQQAVQQALPSSSVTLTLPVVVSSSNAQQAPLVAGEWTLGSNRTLGTEGVGTEGVDPGY